jgi:hypothetical protein
MTARTPCHLNSYPQPGGSGSSPRVASIGRISGNDPRSGLTFLRYRAARSCGQPNREVEQIWFTVAVAVDVGEPREQHVGDDLLRVAVAAYLARYNGLSRYHTESDLRVFLRWCTDRSLDPLAARRVDVELFVRWPQEVRRFKPSTVSRRLSVVICFYRTCVIDAILDNSPAAYVRRPRSRPRRPP